MTYAKIAKTCLRAKPPLHHGTSRHDVIFPDIAILRGGLAFVPEYGMQPSNHGASSYYDVRSFKVRRKS